MTPEHARKVLLDTAHVAHSIKQMLKEYGMPEENTQECADTITKNFAEAMQIGIRRCLESYKDRIERREHKICLIV